MAEVLEVSLKLSACFQMRAQMRSDTFFSVMPKQDTAMISLFKTNVT